MSKIKDPVILDKTGRDIVDKLHTQNLLLNILASSAIEVATDLKEIQRIVQSGNAAKVFNIGDQIIVPWTDRATGTVYQVPHDVVHFQNVTLQDGETVPAMILQWHYCTPFGVQFDAREAFFYCNTALAAGTYYVTVTGSSWGQVAAGTYQFTTTKEVPAGGVLVFNQDIYSSGIAGGTINSYSTRAATEALETGIAVTAGNSGTSLGSFVAAGSPSDHLNSFQCAAYGYNRWAKSAMRQWLNSNAGVGSWWSPSHDYDRPPTELATKHGFKSGYESDFLDIVKPILVTTALNTINDDSLETDHLEDTYDTFFLPALNNMHINPQLAGEGDVYDYWKRVSQSANALSQGGTYPQIRTYAIENHNSAQNVRLRSAHRGNAHNAWHVHSSGGVSYGDATSSYRCAPVCAVC